MTATPKRRRPIPCSKDQKKVCRHSAGTAKHHQPPMRRDPNLPQASLQRPIVHLPMIPAKTRCARIHGRHLPGQRPRRLRHSRYHRKESVEPRWKVWHPGPSLFPFLSFAKRPMDLQEQVDLWAQTVRRSRKVAKLDRLSFPGTFPALRGTNVRALLTA